jgi:hypothetical protein
MITTFRHGLCRDQYRIGSRRSNEPAEPDLGSHVRRLADRCCARLGRAAQAMIRTKLATFATPVAHFAQSLASQFELIEYDPVALAVLVFGIRLQSPSLIAAGYRA